MHELAHEFTSRNLALGAGWSIFMALTKRVEFASKWVDCLFPGPVPTGDTSLKTWLRRLCVVWSWAPADWPIPGCCSRSKMHFCDLKCDDGLQLDGDLQTFGHAYHIGQDAVNHKVPMHCNRKLPDQAWFTKGHETVSRRPTTTLFGAFLREFGDPSSAFRIF